MKFLPLGVAAIILSLTGCASVSVRNVEKRAAKVPAPPAVIYIADYDTRGGDWKITSRSRTPEQFKAEAATFLSAQLAADLHAYLNVPVQLVGKSKVVPPNGWLVSGAFTRVSEGNPAGRIIVGLGLGGSKLETDTVVSDGRVRGPFLRFGTTGGSNAFPGVILSSGPASAVISGVSQAMRGIRDDTRRTSRMITASVVEYEVDKGWMKPNGLKVKKPGEYQLLQPMSRPTPTAAQ